MGIFNFFIVLPEIIASLGFWLADEKRTVTMIGLLAVEVGGGGGV